MKTKLLAVVVAMLFIAGCSGWKISPGAEEVLLQITAQRIGFYTASSDPSLAATARTIAVGIQAQAATAGTTVDALKIIVNAAIDQLAGNFPGDPLLASDLKLLTSLFVPETPATEVKVPVTPALIGSLAGAFVSGVDAAVKQKVTTRYYKKKVK